MTAAGMDLLFYDGKPDLFFAVKPDAVLPARIFRKEKGLILSAFRYPLLFCV